MSYQLVKLCWIRVIHVLRFRICIHRRFWILSSMVGISVPFNNNQEIHDFILCYAVLAISMLSQY